MKMIIFGSALDADPLYWFPSGIALYYKKEDVMTKEQVADQLDGLEYPLEIKKLQREQLAADRLVVVFGASDDLMEFRGAIYDEVGSYGGSTALVDSEGLLPERDSFEGDGSDDVELEHFFGRKKVAKEIKAEWCRDGYSWTYQTNIPHATFEIMDDGEKYCRGIVFSLDELG